MFKWLKTKDKQIEELKKEVEFWQREYNKMCERKNRILNDYGESCRKYADEVQKRLYLIKQIGELVENELYRKAVEEWEAQDDE